MKTDLKLTDEQHNFYAVNKTVLIGCCLRTSISVYDERGNMHGKTIQWHIDCVSDLPQIERNYDDINIYDTYR